MVVNQKTIIMNYFTRSKKNGDTEDCLVEEPADPGVTLPGGFCNRHMSG